MKKIDFIDSLRGIAILGVIAVHATQFGRFDLPTNLANIFLHGDKGVQLFYFTSAFTLFLSLNQRKTTEKFHILNFFIRRFFRIAPMYYFGIIYYLFQDGFGPRYWLGDQGHITFYNVLSNFTFLHGFNPYWINSLMPGGWSIAVEMLFYSITPLIFSKIKNINQALILFIISLIIRLIMETMLIEFPLIRDELLWNHFLMMYLPSQLPVFCLGIIFYFIYTDHVSFEDISGVVLLWLTGFFIIQLVMSYQYIFPMHILFSFVFLLIAIGLNNYRFILIVNPIINYIGKISFSMYIVHFAILHWLNEMNLINFFDHTVLNYLTRLLLVVVLSVIVSSFLYFLIEVNFQKLGKHLITRLDAPAPHKTSKFYQK